MPVLPAIIAFAVGRYGIARPSLWRDEAYTLEAASRSPGQIVALLRHVDAVHGAYYMCMHVVIALFGRSATVIRLPSVAATAVAAGFIAVLGVRLAAAGGTPWPRASGLLAGLLYAVAPWATRYAQEARSYATVTALAVIATYLLVRALQERRRRWWVGYGVAIALAGLFNLLALTIVPAHGVTILIAAARRARAARIQREDPALAAPTRAAPPEAGDGRAPGAAVVPGASAPASASASMQAGTGSGAGWWVVAVIAGAVLLTPVVAAAYVQRGQTSWLVRPGWPQVGSLVTMLAGSTALIAPIAALGALSVTAAVIAGRDDRSLTSADVAVPWLVLPPVILLAGSQVHPLYDFRYVVFCLPAVALLAASGLTWIAGLTARGTAGLAWRPAVTAVAWLPSLATLVFIAAASVAPQKAVRTPSSRPDNLREVSKIVRVYARPGDAVLYITANSRTVSQGYPRPFHELRDIALAASPVSSATLNGTEVSAARLRDRFATASRVWVISDNGPRLPEAHHALDAEKLALVATMRPIRTWHTRQDLLILFARR